MRYTLITYYQYTICTYIYTSQSTVHIHLHQPAPQFKFQQLVNPYHNLPCTPHIQYFKIHIYTSYNISRYLHVYKIHHLHLQPLHRNHSMVFMPLHKRHATQHHPNTSPPTPPAAPFLPASSIQHPASSTYPSITTTTTNH